MPNFPRPVHNKDDGHAHIQFGEDPTINLKKYGYCVVENVFTDNECDNTINQMWEWLEGLGTGIKRNDKTSWNNKNWPINSHQGMIQHTLGQEEFIWKIREHDNVISLFEQIFQTNKLLVSFDAVTIGRSPESKLVKVATNSWLHTDQNIIKNVKLNDVYTSDYYSVQGIANFEDSGDLDACLFIGEKTHLIHNLLFRYNKKEPYNNWYMLSKEDVDYLVNKKIKFTKVNASKGSFILFDSRCIHSGYPHQDNRDEEKLRYVIYVSMSPANRAKKNDIDKKVKAIKEGKTTSHWSSNNIKIFNNPRLYGNEVNIEYLKRNKNIPDYENWNVKRKKLAGLIKYD